MSLERPPNQSPQVLETLAVTLAIVLSLTGGVTAVEMRYAKASDVKQLVDDVYYKTIQLRIFELELKDRSQLQPYEKALLEHLKRELSKS
jgi:hypothetical protein